MDNSPTRVKGNDIHFRLYYQNFLSRSCSNCSVAKKELQKNLGIFSGWHSKVDFTVEA